MDHLFFRKTLLQAVSNSGKIVINIIRQTGVFHPFKQNICVDTFVQVMEGTARGMVVGSDGAEFFNFCSIISGFLRNMCPLQAKEIKKTRMVLVQLSACHFQISLSIRVVRPNF